MHCGSCSVGLPREGRAAVFQQCGCADWQRAPWEGWHELCDVTGRSGHLLIQGYLVYRLTGHWRAKIYIICASTLKIMIVLGEMSFLREFLLPFSFSVLPDWSLATHMVWRCLPGGGCTQLEIDSFFLTYFPKVSCWYRITWGESWARWGLWRSRNRCSGRILVKYKWSKAFQWIKSKAHIDIRDKLMMQHIQ